MEDVKEQEVNAGQDNSTTDSSVDQTSPVAAADVSGKDEAVGLNKELPTTKSNEVSPAGQTGQGPVPPADKNYNELRSWTSRVSNENAEFRKQLAAQTAHIKQMTDLIAKATEKPYDPDQFMEEFRQQGPDFLKKQLETAWKEKETNYLSQIEAIKAEVTGLTITNTVNAMKADQAKYPDFAKLEPEMQRLLQSGVIPQSEVDSKPVGELLVQLYQMAKLQHSQDAIKAAEANGRKAMETELAREARSGVAGGGKIGPQQVLDPSKMTAAQYREMCLKAGLVSDY